GAVGQGDRLVLVALPRCGLAEDPGLAVVVGVGAGGADGAVQQDDHLLEEASGMRAGVELDAGAGGGEDPGDALALEHAGQAAVGPGGAVVVGDGEVHVLNVVLGFEALDGLEEPGVGAGGVEAEQAACLAVHQQARVAVAGQAGAGADDLLRFPGAAVVETAAQQQVDGVGQVVQVGAAVVGGQDGAARGDGEGGDAVLAVAAVATGGEDLPGAWGVEGGSARGWGGSGGGGVGRWSYSGGRRRCRRRFDGVHPSRSTRPARRRPMMTRRPALRPAMDPDLRATCPGFCRLEAAKATKTRTSRIRNSRTWA